MLKNSTESQQLDVNTSRHLHQQLRRRAVIGIAITSLLIGGISSLLLFRAHSKQLETELSLQVALQTVVLESELSRLKNLTTQITSRSRIRQELEKYLRNEVSLLELNKFSRLKLTDAMNQAAGMVAINRLDNNGKRLIEIGDSVPEQLWPQNFLSEKLQLGIPQQVDEQYLLVLSAPIFNRQGIKVGTDLVTFNIENIIDIINSFSIHHNNKGNIHIVMPSPEGVSDVYRTDKANNPDIERLINTEIKRILVGEDIALHQINEGQHSLILMHNKIGDTGWVYCFFEDAEDFFAPAKSQAIFIGTVILILTLVGILVTFFLIRQLSNIILQNTDTVIRLLSARKETESALFKSEERFDLAMRAANDGLWDWNLKTNDVYYSPRWKAMLGYEDDELENHFNTWERLINEEDKLKTLEMIEECKSGKRDSFAVEFRLRHKDGHWVHILTRGLLVRDEQGEAMRFVGTHTDISQRVLAEVALKESESRIRAMFESAQDGILLTDIESREIIDVNPNICKMLGYKRRQLIGKHIEDIHPESDWPRILKEFEIRTSGLSDEMAENIPLLRQDGSVFPSDITVSLMEVANQSCMLGFFRDITERKQDENELEIYRNNLEDQVIIRTRELEELTHYNRTLFETTPVGLLLHDTNGRLIDVNSAYLDIIGYTEDEAKALSFWDITPIEYASQEKHQIQILNETGHYGPYIKEYLHKDGHRITVQLNGLYIMQEEKQCIWSTVEDITERQAAQQALTEAKQAAESAAQAKSDFLANMSHEIRTPLNAVLGLSRMGKRSVSIEKAQEIFKLISESGQNLFRVVNDILDFSKIEAGKLTLEKQAFDLRLSIKNVANLVKYEIEDKGLSFVLEIDNDFPEYVKGDSLRLEQILLNLLSNAIKFTDKGEIKLCAHKNDAGLVFKVIDTGIGMSEAQLAQLFHPFEQADSSTTRRYGGTGLGLSISHNLAIIMGGTLQAKSQSGVGSEFLLELNLEICSAVADTKSKIDVSTKHHLQGVRLLAAEDIEMNRLVLDDMLTEQGAQVIFAEDGKQAIELLEKHGVDAFDVVLMDIQMPVMDGHEATQHIRNLAPGLPVIGLTAHALAMEKERCLSSGMVAHVAKPVDISELVGVILQYVKNDGSVVAPVKDGVSKLVKDNNKTEHSALPKMADDVIDWPALSERYQGREKTIRKFIATALRTHEGSAEKLRVSIKNNDIEAIQLVAHSLQGMAGFLEAHQLKKLADEIEKDARLDSEKTLQLGTQLAESMDKMLDRLLQAMV